MKTTWLVLMVVCGIASWAAGQDQAFSSTVGQPQQQRSETSTATGGMTVSSYCQTMLSKNLAAACEFALTGIKRLPNFVCSQKTTRYQGSTAATSLPTPADMSLSDVIAAEVTFVDGRESYSKVTQDGKPRTSGFNGMGGVSSTGEFGVMLLNVFAPRSHARFVFVKKTKVNGQTAELFQFQVPAVSSLWALEKGSFSMRPAYHGLLWLDKATARVIRLEQDANIDSAESTAFYKKASLEIDYQNVMIGGRGPFVLPSRSNLFVCTKSASWGGRPPRVQCSMNTLVFSNCHKFEAQARIMPAE